MRRCACWGCKVSAMNWQELIALLMLSTAASFTSGPNTALSTALAANEGLGRAMTFVLAVPVGWGALVATAVWMLFL